MARELALAMASRHLVTGHDVVVPQFVARPEFVGALASVAVIAGAVFVEVVLDAPAEIVIGRFRSRRTAVAGDAVRHPETDVDEAAIDSTVTNGVTTLRTTATNWSGVVYVDASGDIETTYELVVRATRGLNAHPGQHPDLGCSRDLG